jgi:cobalt-zinc-cadmium efflux system membrane fusion protein
MHRSFLLSLALVAAACGAADEVAPEATAVAADTALLTAEAVRIGGFSLAAVTEESWQDAWHLPARVTLDPATTQPLGSIVEGRILEIRVFPGDVVREGDVLAVIHSHEVMDARQMLAAARARAIGADSGAAVAVGAAARAERLLAVKAVSLAEVERARAARASAVAGREAAHAELESAEALLEHLVGEGTPEGVEPHAALIRAPFAGVVTGRSAQPGQVVLVGQPLVTVARGAALGVILRLPEEATASVQRGASVRFTVPAYPGRTFTARVARIAPVVDSVSRAIEVWAPAAAEGQRVLRAEMTADAELLGAGGGPVTRAVPAGAIQLMEGDTVVVLASRLGEGMLIESRRVRVGRRTSLQAEILDGVVPGDSVLLGGAALGKAELLKRRGGGEGGE